MATHFIDPEGRSHWAEEDSNFAKSGLESGHLRRAGEPAPEKVDETDKEAEDATVEQDGDGEDAVSDPDGSGDAKPARSGSRRR